MKELRKGIMPINDVKRIFVQVQKGGERITGWVRLPSREWLNALTDPVTISTHNLIIGEIVNVTGKLVWVIPEEQEPYWITWFKTMLGH